jgi:hypothetical protein
MNRRQVAGSLGGHISWARTADRSARTQPARAKSPASVDYWLERQTDELKRRPIAERVKAAENAKAAHYKIMALRSLEARRRNKAA